MVICEILCNDNYDNSEFDGWIKITICRRSAVKTRVIKKVAHISIVKDKIILFNIQVAD